MNLEDVRTILIPFLTEHAYTLYDLAYVTENGEKILRVLLNKKGGITLDDLTLVNEFLSNELDKYDQNDEAYMLEVSSMGAEALLRNREEIKEHIGEYVNIVTNEAKYEGVLLAFEDDVLSVKVNLKGRFKIFSVPYQKISKIRLAIKF